MTRYDIYATGGEFGCTAEMEPYDQGEWVRFEDIKHLLAEGYDETGEEERQLAEADMAAGSETLPD